MGSRIGKIGPQTIAAMKPGICCGIASSGASAPLPSRRDHVLRQGADRRPATLDHGRPAWTPRPRRAPRPATCSGRSTAEGIPRASARAPADTALRRVRGAMASRARRGEAEGEHGARVSRHHRAPPEPLVGQGAHRSRSSGRHQAPRRPAAQRSSRTAPRGALGHHDTRRAAGPPAGLQQPGARRGALQGAQAQTAAHDRGADSALGYLEEIEATTNPYIIAACGCSCSPACAARKSTCAGRTWT